MKRANVERKGKRERKRERKGWEKSNNKRGEGEERNHASTRW